jgi:serine/threonine protein kinase
MSRSSRRRRPHEVASVRLFGRHYTVQRPIEVRRRTYLLLDRVSTSRRERYLAFDPYAGSRGAAVAVVILPRSAAGTRQHIDVLQRVAASHDAFPTILDYEARRDEVVIVLKWVEGPTLGEYLDSMRTGRCARISSVLAFQRCARLAHGIARWHLRTQIVHADIKPDNIVVARDPGRLVLIDFGSAWTTQAAASRASGDGFSAVYAAPELQSLNAHGDFRSDQFSWSVLLYELLTLSIPYDQLGGRAGRPEFARQPTDTLPPPSRLSPERDQVPAVIWQGMDQVVQRGLALDPGQRYPTPNAWLDDIDRVGLDIQRPPRAGANRGLSTVWSRLARVFGGKPSKDG